MSDELLRAAKDIVEHVEFCCRNGGNLAMLSELTVAPLKAAIAAEEAKCVSNEGVRLIDADLRKHVEDDGVDYEKLYGGAATEAKPAKEPWAYGVEYNGDDRHHIVYEKREEGEAMARDFELEGYRPARVVALYRQPPVDAEEMRLLREAESVTRSVKANLRALPWPGGIEHFAEFWLPKLEHALAALDAYRANGKTKGDYMDTRPRIVCLCGSTRFGDAFRAANLQETLAGRIVLSIGCDFKSDQGLGLTKADKDRLDELHKRKIDLADEILVLNVGGYIGTSTRSEIDYAIKHKKVIRYMEEEP